MKETFIAIVMCTCFLVLLSCNGKTKNVKEIEKLKVHMETNITDKEVFDDIDLYNLKGINKIATPLNYPYIKIDSLDKGKKRIVYKISERDSVERFYTLDNKHWTTTYEFKTDTGFSRVYEYISPMRIIELTYDGTYKKTNYYLHDASLIENNKEIMYSFFGEKGIDVNPKIENFDLVKSIAKAVFNRKFHNTDGMLFVTNSSFDKTENKIFFSDTTCYQTNNHSWFWWKMFGSKPVKCK